MLRLYDHKFSLLKEMDLTLLKEFSSISIFKSTVSPNGDVLAICTVDGGQDQRQRALILFKRGLDTPIVVRTFPLIPNGLAAMDDGGFALLMLSANKERDYSSIAIVDSSGKLSKSFARIQSLNLPNDTNGIRDFGGSKPDIAVAGSDVYVFIPVLSEIFHFSSSGDIVEKIPVRTPEGMIPYSVSNLSVNADGLLAVSMSAKGDPYARVVLKAANKPWSFAMSDEADSQIVLGADRGQTVIALERARKIVWMPLSK